MGTQIGELFVKIGADVTSFTKGITTVGDGMKGFSSRLAKDIETGNLSIQSLGANMMKAAGPAGIMAGAVAGLGIAAVLAGKQVYDFTMTVERSKDNLADLASEAGLSMETISGLQLVAMKAGMTVDDLAGSFKFLGKAVKAAQDITSEQAGVFRQLGISITDASGNLKPSIELFKEISTAIQKLPDGLEKSTIEMTLFGKAGVKLNEVLNMGGKELEAQIERGQELANVTRKDAEEAQRLIDANAELTLLWQGMKNELAGGLTPALVDAIKYMTYFVEEVRGADDVWDGVIKSIDDGTTSVWSQVGALGELYKAWKKVKFIAAPNWFPMEDKGSGSPWAEGSDVNSAGELVITPKTKPSGGGGGGSTGGGGGSGKTKAELEAEARAIEEKQRAEWDEQDLKDQLAAEQFAQDQALLEQLAIYDQGEIELQLIVDANNKKLEEQKRFQDMYKRAITSTFQGGTDIMASALADMIRGQKVSGKKMIQAAGEMIGGIAAQLGDSFILEGAGYLASSMIPGSPHMGSTASALQLIAAGTALKTFGALIGGGGGSGGGGGGGKGKGKGGGGGGGALASAPAAAASPAADLPGGMATINIVGGDSAIFTGAQVRALIEQVNEQLDKGMTLRVA